MSRYLPLDSSTLTVGSPMCGSRGLPLVAAMRLGVLWRLNQFNPMEASEIVYDERLVGLLLVVLRPRSQERVMTGRCVGAKYVDAEGFRFYRFWIKVGNNEYEVHESRIMGVCGKMHGERLPL